MDKSKNYLFLVLLHIAIGVIVFILPVLSKIYGFAIIFGGMYYVVKNRNRNNEVLFAAAYIVGSEVFLRMTDGNPLYEFSKYGVIIFIFTGMYFSGFNKNAVPYWIFLLLLLPGVIIATQTLDHDAQMRKTISFNISGPVCLGIASLYTYTRKVTLAQIRKIMLLVGLPVITSAVYLILYTPNIRDVITGTDSNYMTSGGFGPNQVATILGLGMFVFVSRMFLDSSTRLIWVVNLVIAVTIGFRGLVTFSRGGMITGLLMLVVLAMITYLRVNYKGKRKINYMAAFLVIVLMSVWSYSSIQTGGLIEKRYSNQDATGKVKESQLSGREGIAQTEINDFLDNPVFGIGVAKGMELRKEATGDIVTSHNEITRMLAEHGAMGIMALIILFWTPLFLYLDNKHHIYLLCFLLFWFMTINHAAMRLAAPAFLYALSLLKVIPDEAIVVHRE